jgi:hypothetical protein
MIMMDNMVHYFIRKTECVRLAFNGTIQICFATVASRYLYTSDAYFALL